MCHPSQLSIHLEIRWADLPSPHGIIQGAPQDTSPTMAYHLTGLPTPIWHPIQSLMSVATSCHKQQLQLTLKMLFIFSISDNAIYFSISGKQHRNSKPNRLPIQSLKKATFRTTSLQGANDLKINALDWTQFSRGFSNPSHIFIILCCSNQPANQPTNSKDDLKLCNSYIYIYNVMLLLAG